MYEAQSKLAHALMALAMMRLRRNNSDASKFIAIGTAFSEFVALLPVGAGLQSHRGVYIRESLKHLSNMLRSKHAALTIRSSGPANTPLRSVSAVH